MDGLYLARSKEMAFKVHMTKCFFSPVLNVLKHEYLNLWHDFDYNNYDRLQEMTVVVTHCGMFSFPFLSILVLSLFALKKDKVYTSVDLRTLEYFSFPFFSSSVHISVNQIRVFFYFFLLLLLRFGFYYRMEYDAAFCSDMQICL